MRVRAPRAPQKSGWTRRRGGTGHPRGSSEDAARHRLLWVWSMVFTAAAFLIIVGFAVFWVRSHRRVPAPGDSEPAPAMVRIASRFVAPSEDEALALVREAIANRDPAMVEAIVRRGATDAVKVVEFMEALETRDGPVRRMSWLGSMDVDGLLMEGVWIKCAGETSPVERLAFLVSDEVGVWKMDFEAFARTCTPGWRDFLGGGAKRARVRVVVGKDSYYNGPFIDESEWESFALAAPEAKELLPEGRDLLRGYCRRNSPQARAMARIFKDEAKKRRATLEIQRTDGADSRQFEITRVLAEDWVVQARPFDEKFE